MADQQGLLSNLPSGLQAQSADYASQGSYGLKVTTADEGWFGTSFGLPINLTGKTHIKFEIKALAAGTSTNAAIQVGAGWERCQGTWCWVNLDTIATVDIDLLNLGCAATDLSQANSIDIWFSSGGTFYLDNVRAE